MSGHVTSSSPAVSATEEMSHVVESWVPSPSAAASIVQPSAPHEDDNLFVEANILPADWSAQTSYLYSGRSNSRWGGSTPRVVNLCVTAKPRHVENKSIIMEPEEFPIRHCCSNKGCVMLGWDTDSAVASPGASVRVVIVGSNSSTVEIKHLLVRWMETVSWNARGQSQSEERILDESIVPIRSRPEWHALRRLPHGRSFSSRHGGGNTC